MRFAPPSRYEVRSHLVHTEDWEHNSAVPIDGTEQMVGSFPSGNPLPLQICHSHVNRRSEQTAPDYTVIGQVWAIDDNRPEMALYSEEAAEGSACVLHETEALRRHKTGNSVRNGRWFRIHEAITAEGDSKNEKFSGPVWVGADIGPLL